MRNTQKAAELRVSHADLVRMDRAAAVIAECRDRLAAQCGDILGEIDPSAAAPCDWRHYPDGEVYDPESHAQYFYHAHPAGVRPPREHGHFHTFLRAEGMPSGVAPLLLPETAIAEFATPPQGAPLRRGGREEVSHLVAISLDARGEPIRLFTTNRWVTGETWYRAEDVIAMLDRFVISENGRSAVLDRWLVAVIELFRPQITDLLRARDETVMAWRRRRRTNVFEDPRLEITSSIEVELGAQLALLDQVRSKAFTTEQPRLPRMAEGWGESHPE